MKIVKLFLVMASLLCASPLYAGTFTLTGSTSNSNPVADIKANGKDTTQTVTSGSSVAITITLDSGNKTGTAADWWVLYKDSSNAWKYYNLSTMVSTTSVTTSPTYQGNLGTLATYTVLSTTSLAAGTYTFYFGVDTTKDGVLTTGASNLFYDSISVVVQ
ncbi:MAG: hypothetical protein HQK84_02390 [Nitrospinae bacterium]|nr:hypothetical protein [Nitrospinota bacterium]